jgi:oxalate decarboxylase/phosphoglucose isomerase-like protein (cupin superfamily)
LAVQARVLKDFGDNRGSSFTVPAEVVAFLGRVADVHIATVVPGAVRGNHFHLRRKEAVVVIHQTEWMLHWDNSDSSPASTQHFPGTGAEVICVDPGHAHAVQNTGAEPLILAAFSSEAYEPSETVAWKIT